MAANAEYVPVLSVKKGDICLLAISGIEKSADCVIQATVLGIMPITGTPPEQMAKIGSFCAMADSLFAVGVHDDEGFEAPRAGRAWLPRDRGLGAVRKGRGACRSLPSMVPGVPRVRRS